MRGELAMASDRSVGEFDRQLRDVRYELLDEATEDSIGLWEAPMTARKLFPDLDHDQQMAIAKRAVRDLLDDELIAFHWRNDPNASERIGRDEVMEELGRAKWWQPPQSSDPSKNWYQIDWLWMTATERGQEERDRQTRMRFSSGDSA
jgi:hypothetical protein